MSDQPRFGTSVTDHQIVFHFIRFPHDRIVGMKRSAVRWYHVGAETIFVKKQVHQLVPGVSSSFDLCIVKPMILDLLYIVPFLFFLESRVFTKWMRKPLVHKQVIRLFEGLKYRFLETGKKKCEC